MMKHLRTNHSNVLVGSHSGQRESISGNRKRSVVQCHTRGSGLNNDSLIELEEFSEYGDTETDSKPNVGNVKTEIPSATEDGDTELKYEMASATNNTETSDSSENINGNGS